MFKVEHPHCFKMIRYKIYGLGFKASAEPWLLRVQVNTTYCGFDNPSCGPQFVSDWVSSHMDDATQLGKPVIMEEFGKQIAASSSYQTVWRTFLGRFGY